jgi:hypothetical protein
MSHEVWKGRACSGIRKNQALVQIATTAECRQKSAVVFYAARTEFQIAGTAWPLILSRLKAN